MTNDSLPPLPAWHARSFYASLLMIATVCAHAFGFDLMAFFARRFGLPDQGAVLDFVDALMPIAFALWAWIERRAPHFRLVWRRVL